MTSVLKNFVSIKKTRGDVLKPAEFRSIVEMILGILKNYDYEGFKEAYKSFLSHLTNFNDPHKYTETSFIDEIVDLVYSIYQNMVQTPISEEEFRETVVPNMSFFELIRRIILNHWLYLRIKNPDGSVPQSVTVKLTSDWGPNVSQGSPITVSFGEVLENETAFIRKGWGGNTTPIPVIFNALDLSDEFKKTAILFHTSQAYPYETVLGSTSGYPISILGSSNDLNISGQVNSTPSQNTTILTLVNDTRTVTVTYNSNSTISVKLDAATIFNSVNCNDGKFSLAISRKGKLDLTTFHNGVATVTTQNVSFTNVVPFTTALVGIPTVKSFVTSFGFKSLTIYKTSDEDIVPPEILPIIYYLPQATSIPLVNTTSQNLISQMFVPQLGYKVYLTLYGTWIGEVAIEISRDSGVTWSNMTTNGGDVIGFYSTNCDESIGMVNNPLVRLRLNITVSSGSVSYRLAQ